MITKFAYEQYVVIQVNLMKAYQNMNFEECKEIAVCLCEDFVLKHRVKSEGRKIYCDWRTIFYSARFRRMMVLKRILD